MIISYIYTSSRGYLRSKNEDNFWCGGSFLPEEHDNSPIIARNADIAQLPVLCLFDGMGGEQAGETASFLCAETFDECFHDIDRSDMHAFLETACVQMNLAVSAYAKNNRIGSMGSTAALLGFSPERIYACNIGDSRIYRLHTHTLEQISTDHTCYSPFTRNNVLTQHIGLDPAEVSVVPDITDCPCSFGDLYLLCSDGLTDMVPESRIMNIVSSPFSLRQKTEELMSSALENGGLDNITLILCQIRQIA